MNFTEVSSPFEPCPRSPNCVSSLAVDPSHHVEPIAFDGDPGEALHRLTDLISSMDGARLVSETGDYRYLRNVVILATFYAGLAIFYLDEGRSGALTWIWIITAGWIIIGNRWGSIIMP